MPNIIAVSAINPIPIFSLSFLLQLLDGEHVVWPYELSVLCWCQQISRQIVKSSYKWQVFSLKTSLTSRTLILMGRSSREVTNTHTLCCLYLYIVYKGLLYHHSIHTSTLITQCLACFVRVRASRWTWSLMSTRSCILWVWGTSFVSSWPLAWGRTGCLTTGTTSPWVHTRGDSVAKASHQ